jgi:DNA-binding Xre family transcriptional regulator
MIINNSKAIEFKNLLLIAITEKKIRKLAIAEKLGISYPTCLTKLKDPFNKLSANEIYKICDLLNLHYTDLLT